MDELALWNEAEPLSYAWFAFATDREKKGFRNAPGRDATTAHENLMKVELFARLASGELTALGIKVASEGNPVPEVIPAILFERPPDHEFLSSDAWRHCRLEFVGRVWEDVRIARRSVIASTETQNKPKRKVGRRSVDDLLREVVRQLILESQLNDIPRSKQEDRVRERARKKHPNLFTTSTRPSREKIRQALKAEGLIDPNPEV